MCIPICSMYGIFIYICPNNHPNVGKYTIHGAYGIYIYIHINLDHMHQIVAGPDPSLKTQCVKQKLKNPIGTTQKQNQYMPRICNYRGMDHGYGS